MEYFDFFLKVIQREAEKFNLPLVVSHFTELKTDANYDVASNRCAHMYRYATNTLYFMNKYFSDFFSECPEAIKIFQKLSLSSDLNFTSISSGPGIEFIAFMMSLRNYENIKIEELFKNVKILSKFGAWRNTMNIMLDVIEAGEFKCLEPVVLNRENIELIQISPFFLLTLKLKDLVRNSSIVLMIRAINLKQSDAELEGEISANLMEFFSILKPESLLFCIDTKPSCTLMANNLMKFHGKFLHAPSFHQDRLPVMFPESFIERFGCLPVLSYRGGFFVWQRLRESSLQQNVLSSPYNASIFNTTYACNLDETNRSLYDTKNISNEIGSLANGITKEVKANQEQYSDDIEHLVNKLLYSTTVIENKQNNKVNPVQSLTYLDPAIQSGCVIETNSQASLNMHCGEDHSKSSTVSPLFNTDKLDTSTPSTVPLSKIIRPSTYETPATKGIAQQGKNKELENNYNKESSNNDLIIFGNGDIQDNVQKKTNVSNLINETSLEKSIQQCIKETGVGNNVSCSKSSSRSDLPSVGNEKVEQNNPKDISHSIDETAFEKKVQQCTKDKESEKSISCNKGSSSSDLVSVENENIHGAIPKKINRRAKKNKNKAADPPFITREVQTDPVSEFGGSEADNIKILTNRIQQLTSSFEKLLAEQTISFGVGGLSAGAECSHHQYDFTNNGIAYNMHPQARNSYYDDFPNINNKCNQQPSYNYAQSESSNGVSNCMKSSKFQKGHNVMHCCAVKNHCFQEHHVSRCCQMPRNSLRNQHSSPEEPNIVIPLGNMSNDIISQLMSILKSSSKP